MVRVEVKFMFKVVLGLGWFWGCAQCWVIFGVMVCITVGVSVRFMARQMV